MDKEIISMFGDMSECIDSALKEVRAHRPGTVKKVEKVVGLIEAGGVFYQVRLEIDSNRKEFIDEILEEVEALEKA